MIKVRIIYAKEIKRSTPGVFIVAQELEHFINLVGYENIKQILVSRGLYTVIYEE